MRIVKPQRGSVQPNRLALQQCVLAMGFSAMISALTWASQPTRNSVGASFSVVSLSSTSTVEIRLRPKAAFDTVTVEAGSGVASLNPPCSFHSVVPDGSYACRVDVTHKASDASLTINVVARVTGDPARPARIEISHFTLANSTYIRPKTGTKATHKPLLQSSPGAGPAR